MYGFYLSSEFAEDKKTTVTERSRQNQNQTNLEPKLATEQLLKRLVSLSLRIHEQKKSKT